jgi:hypothetical protein
MSCMHEVIYSLFSWPINDIVIRGLFDLSFLLTVEYISTICLQLLHITANSTDVLSFTI